MKASTNKKLLIMLGVFLLISLAALTSFLSYITESEIKSNARKACVEPIFYVPALKVTFTTPLREKEEWTKEEIQAAIDSKFEESQKDAEERIKEVIEEAKEVPDSVKYKFGLTEFEKWGYESPSKTNIPLGAFVPDYAKFPKKVLVAYKTEKKEITAWEKEYEKDILTFSEAANISIATAKAALTTLRTSGYSITKTEVDEAAEVTLLWFSSGWEDEYPITLDWKVTYVGEDANLIVGYDLRGVLETKPLDDDKPLHIKAGYHDLNDKYKPKALEVIALEIREKQLEKEKADLEKTVLAQLDEICELTKEEEQKRDISKTTILDLIMGNIKLENLWMMGGGSGVFLGNMKVNENFKSWGGRAYGHYVHEIEGESKGIILTNAHVASMALAFSVEVSEDLETLWVFYPGIPFVRYTQNSSTLGSPAEVLVYDNLPVLTMDFDTGILVTSAVPSYEKYKSYLGDSDNVKEGDRVIAVGNPMFVQKFLTEGVVSNTSYSLLNSPLSDPWLYEGIRRSDLIWLQNSSFWVDVSIGAGGTSGSAVYALGGSEKGKVIALRNMGLVTSVAVNGNVSTNKDGLDIKGLGIVANDDVLITIMAKENGEKLFANFSYEDAEFSMTMEEFEKKEPSIKATKLCSGRVSVEGMNGSIPINKVKAYLQERGMDPNHFGWEGLQDEYWEK